MRILLINHHYYSIREFTYYEKFFDPIPVMGLGYLAAAARDAGHETAVIDDYAQRFGIEGILKFIGEFKPGIVGTSCLTPLADEAALLARKIKERYPEVCIVFGHRHADFFADDIVGKRIADIVVHGEGEKTLVDLAEALSSQRPLADVLGITYLDDGRSKRTHDRPFIENLDSIPFPAWDLFPLHLYRPCAEVMPGGKRHLPLLTSRGCPYDCVFCTQEMGKRVRVRSADNIVAEMEWVHNAFGVDGLILFDANFPLVRKQALELCEKMIAKDLPSKIRWTTETRPDRIDEEMLHLMKRAGCEKIQVGFESGSDRILRVLKKGFTLDDSKRAVGMIRKAGIGIYGLFIIGSPTETLAEIRDTVDFALSMELDFSKFNLFVPYPGTEAYDDPSVKSRLKGERWINFTSYPPDAGRVIYTPEGLTPEELLIQQKKAFLRFYLRPRMIYRQVMKIKHISMKEYWDGLTYVLRSLFDLATKRRRVKACSAKPA